MNYEKLGSSVPNSYYQNVSQREDMRPQQPCSATAPSPIKTAIDLLESRVGHLQTITEQLFSALQPVTTKTDDAHNGEPCVPRDGNSPLNVDLNAMSDRIALITAALQFQVDRLEI